jgi:hypothetical protein
MIDGVIAAPFFVEMHEVFHCFGIVLAQFGNHDTRIIHQIAHDPSNRGLKQVFVQILLGDANRKEFIVVQHLLQRISPVPKRCGARFILGGAACCCSRGAPVGQGDVLIDRKGQFALGVRPLEVFRKPGFKQDGDGVLLALRQPGGLAGAAIGLEGDQKAQDCGQCGGSNAKQRDQNFVIFGRLIRNMAQQRLEFPSDEKGR